MFSFCKKGEYMKYCFVTEDIKNDEKNSGQFHLQAKYAEKIALVCYCDLELKEIVDTNGNRVSVNGEKILLRASIETIIAAQELLVSAGAVLIENASDIEKIENWIELGINKRGIKRITVGKLLQDCIADTYEIESEKEDLLFVKSIKKGFSICCSRKNLNSHNDELMKLLRKYNYSDCDQVLVSKYYEIEKDSLGKKEARFIVLDNTIINCSRYLWGLHHNVPGQLKRKAEETVSMIAKLNFPANYVLDMGIFQSEREPFVDVVEINPLTTSWCYINNSIFIDVVNEIKPFKTRYSYGNEYLLDYMKNPEKYHLSRQYDVCYELLNENRYYF